jgi:hypothetical protein
MRWLCLAFAIGCGSNTDKSAFDNPAEWQCSAATPEPTGKEVTLDFKLRTVPTGEAKGFNWRVCNRSDLSCATPIANGGGDVINAKVPEAFDGFVEVNKDVLVWMPFPVYAGANKNLGSLPPTFLGPPYLPNRGHVMVRIVDCNNRDAEGVAITINGADDRSTYYYFENSGFTTAAQDTNTTGLAAVQHVPAGTVTVVASIFGKSLGERQIAVRANSVSTIEFRAMR